MKFENVTIMELLPTQKGVSKQGNDWMSQEVVFNLNNRDADHPQKLVAKVFNKDLIAQLSMLTEGVTLGSIDVDFDANTYNGRWYNNLRLWRISYLPNGSQVQPIQGNADPFAQQLDQLGF